MYFLLLASIILLSACPYRYFMADFMRGWVKTLSFSGNSRTVTSSATFDTNIKNILSFKEGKDVSTGF